MPVTQVEVTICKETLIWDHLILSSTLQTTYMTCHTKWNLNVQVCNHFYELWSMILSSNSSTTSFGWNCYLSSAHLVCRFTCAKVLWIKARKILFPIKLLWEDKFLLFREVYVIAIHTKLKGYGNILSKF